ncbi:MAG: hypothetical protein ACRDMA_04770 [Solirubrobacterales bacterium]
MPTRKTDLPMLEPDPLEPRPAEVEDFIRALQGLRKSEADLARRATWSQIRLAGMRARSRPHEALETLNLIFRLGKPPKSALSGPYDGILVTPSVWRPADRALTALSAAWMPWVGKRFDADAGRGDNLFRPGARSVARVLWPGYRPWEAPEGLLGAFRFRTHTSPGTVDPDREALKIDYDSDENPGLLIRDILDELVEVVPGAYLGKVLLRRGGADAPRWRLVAYFALQPPETVAVPEQPESAAEPAPAPA